MSMSTRRRPLGDIGNTLVSQVPGQARKPESRPRSNSLSSPRVDDRHRHDPLHAVEYLKEIYEHFRETETRNRPTGTYLGEMQTDINEKMRAILVDWMVDVHLKFKLLPETLYLSVELVDRFLDRKVVNRTKLQLVGVVAMLLASKYEEIYPPEVKDFIYIAANTYTRDDVLRMERLMFQTMDFNLTVPTGYVFLKRGLQVLEGDNKTNHLAHYCSELALMDYKMLKFAPSMVAASSIYLANKCIPSRECWSRTMEHYTGYKSSDLAPCVADMLAIARNAPNVQKTQAIRKKYSYAKFSEVSKLVSFDLVQLP
eukprot:NODE_2627_length_1375_cov_286.179712_g2162_i1.p1 GENE.NODE_2627_length_1375_cov_286.179712_g2162_i1~~NODE_2627_length_1375_cov_286.179712_g2162_i1.p1  ORF type:complete len:313 (-),score=37.26 NODE_2627_length_1375_cov_286.179712_g2162_i1:365-1303(-)